MVGPRMFFLAFLAITLKPTLNPEWGRRSSVLGRINQGRIGNKFIGIDVGYPMPKYVLWGSYCENALEKRTPYRQQHLEGLAALKSQGILLTLGPTQDNTQVFGIYEAASADEVRQLVENDPYWKNGIWTEYQVKEWIQAF